MSTQSWRAYGGTQHYEVNNNLSVNNLVVGNLTLKNQYFGFLDINGTFSVSGLTTLNNNLIVKGEQNTYGNFNVYGQAAFYNEVSFANSLAIAGNIVVNGTVEALSTFIMYSDLQVAGNIYVTNNVLAMGYNFSSSPQNDNPIYSGALVCNAYHEGAFMGINTPYTTGVLPGATLDIFSDSSNNPLTTSALNVYATGPKTQSIVSSNRFHQGAIIYTDPSQCSLHWFSDTSLVSHLKTCETNTDVSYAVYPYVTDASANRGDATLVYKKGGEMALTVSKNVAIASHMSVGSQLLGGKMGMGDVFVQDGTTGHTAFQETVTMVSDASSAFFPRYYTADAAAVPGYNAQSALTMVAGDACGNDHTAWSMMTQTGRGTRAVGGSYIYDSGRAMGGSGLILDASGDWIPTVMTVQNKSLQGTQPAYGRSVTGFNTYAPPLDNYGVVINGPTHLTNGEITVVADVSFEIKRVAASAREPTAVLATGVPISYNSSENYFGFSVLTSSDAGQNWTSYDISSHAIGSNLSPRNYNYIQAATVYDSMSALFALNYGGYVFVSTDRLTTWNPMVLQYANSNRFFKNGVNAIAVLDVNTTSNLVVLLDVSNASHVNTGYNLGYIFLDASHSLTRSLIMGPQGLTHPNFHLQEGSGDEMMDISFSYVSFPTHMDAAYAMDGYDTSYVFVAGSGISKYMIMSAVGSGYGMASTPVTTWHLNGSYTYRAMKTYKTYYATVDGKFLNGTDPMFSVFVGDGIITTTSDAGGTFTDVSAGFRDMVFRDVVIYDVSRALVTGVDGSGGGVVMATYNAGRTWITPYHALNAGGTMNLLLAPDASRNLVSIAQTGQDNFLVVRVDVQYDLTYNTGYSRFCHCHVPMLFHRSATVMDMCGSLWVSGSATIEDNLTVGGVITCPVTTIQSDYRLKTEVVPLCDVSGSVVDALNPVQYTNVTTGIQDVGFLAHEVAEQFPFLVHGDKDAPEAYQSLNYTGLIGILVKEIQDLKRRVAVLETAGP